MLTKIANREKSLAGCWRLPAMPDMDECVTLLPNKTLEWTLVPASSLRTVRTMITGEKMTGTWSVRAARPTVALDRLRSRLGSSSAVLAGSSAQLFPKLARERKPAPQKKYLPSPSAKTAATVAHPPAECWLMLKVTNFPQSLLNLNICGTKLDVVDWVHNLREVFADHAHAVIAYSVDSLTLQLPNGRQVTWERVSKFFPDAVDQD